MDKPMNRLAWAVAVVIAVGGSARADDKDEAAKEKKATIGAQVLMQACEAYYLSPKAEGLYPVVLGLLAKPPWGGVSFLKDPKKDLLDPWCQPYKYAVVADDKGFDHPYVWAERTVGGKTKVFGRKPPEKKK